MEEDFHFVDFDDEPGVELNSEGEERVDDYIAPSPSSSKRSNSKCKNNNNNNNNNEKIGNIDKNQKKKNDQKNNDNDSNDDLIAIKSIRAEMTKELSLLRQEKKELIQFRHDLQNKIGQSETINNDLRSQLQSINNLHKELEKEISSCCKTRTSVEVERTNLKLEYEKYQKDIKAINNEKWNEFENFYQKNENLYHKFNEYYANINNMNNKINQELTSLTKLKQQQQDIVNNCQQQLNTICKTNTNELLPKLSKIEEGNKNNNINNLNLCSDYNGEVDQSNNNNNSNSNNDNITIQQNNVENIIELEKNQAYACKKCGTHITKECDIESRCYQVGQGNFSEKKRGYLFKNGYNLELKPSKIENFTTGSYTISWTHCVKCNSQIGWKYLAADNPNNQTKVGKYCLSRYSLTSPAERNEF